MGSIPTPGTVFMNNNPIGIIDSGVGGLSIASVLIKNLPQESFVYAADSKNCPYGDKTEAEIYNLTRKMVDFLIAQNIKLLVVACNTITVTSIEKLRKDYPKLPVVGIVPVIKSAVKYTKNKKIGIFSTVITANSNYQKSLIKDWTKDYSVLNLGTSKLVPLIEKLDFDSIDNILEQELEPFVKAKIDALALGCSHFPLIKDKIQKFLPNVLILDSAEAVSSQVKKILEHNNLVSNSVNRSYNFYNSADLEPMEYFVDKLTKEAGIERISL